MNDVANPFVVHRRFLDTYAEARAAGWSDDRWCGAVAALDDAIAEVDGTGFRVTPLVALTVDGVERPVWAKVETGSVAGSHKARHLFALALALDAGGVDRSTELAIASCGNAALAAATVARAAGRPLRVFVPTEADPWILGELDRLGARVAPCPREEGTLGDPCMHGLEAALAGGALPFTVQGPICPGSVDGARTLGLELAEQLTAIGVADGDLFVQVGGGALGTAVGDGLERSPFPTSLRLHPVQAAAAAPYAATWQRILGLAGADATVDRLVATIAEHPEAMTPWPGTPASVAGGILDDVTYDWATLMTHQVRSGGRPVTVDEATFVAAAGLAAGQVDPAPDETGAAGLAGLLTVEAGPDGAGADRGRAGDPAVVLLTGCRRPTLST